MKMDPAYFGKWAVITGGSEGIGLSIARDLVSMGANVLICARDLTKLQTAQAQLEGLKVRPEQKTGVFSLDVTQINQVKTTIEKIVAQTGVPDYWINCAGMAIPGYFDQQPQEQLEEMMQTNFWGSVYTSREILKHYMRVKNRGTLVNTSSVAGFLGLYGYSGYCASKYAILGFTKALYQEFKPHGIHVATLCPPNTKTPGFARENRNKPEELLKMEARIKETSPEYVSRVLLKGLKRKKYLIIPTFEAWLTHWLDRHFPWFMDMLTTRKPQN